MSTENKDIFKYDIFDSAIYPPTSSKFELCGLSLPSNQDIYFMSKWHEIFDRYASARLFLREAVKDNLDDWQHWFNLTDNSKTNKIFMIKLQSEMYETALINYNILVDLSWTITYVSAEYILYKYDAIGNVINSTEILTMSPIEEAYKILRNEENLVSSPNSKQSQFTYLKKMCPNFSAAIDIIIKFWTHFSNSNIRSLYNFIKHKGKPLYKEYNDYNPSKFFGITIGNTSFPSDIRDVQKIIKLKDSIQELIDFDDNQLFPYLTSLILELKKVVNPSPMIL